MMGLGFALFKWRKRRAASVYDRPPPPGIYSEEEKRDAEVTVMYAGETPQRPQEERVSGGGGAFGMVRNLMRGSGTEPQGARLGAPEPTFVMQGRNRDTGSEAQWG